MIGSKRVEEKEEDETLVAEILEKDLEGLGRPLKVRLECVYIMAKERACSSGRCVYSRLSRVKKA